MLKEIQERIAEAGRAGTPLELRGSGSKRWYGQAPQGELLDLSGYEGIVDYDAAELVLTARCGTPLSQIEAELARRRQTLAFDPPRFSGSGGTIGGVIASGLSGPRRISAGSARDFVLGARLLDGKGAEQSFGGRVMKNVAGYDVSRLLAGSLGVITEVSIKVMPMPFADLSLEFEVTEGEAVAKLNSWGGQPLPLAASSWLDGRLRVRLCGAEAAVNAARGRLGGEPMAEMPAEVWWRGLRDQTAEFFAPAVSGARALWRLSLPSAAMPLDLRAISPQPCRQLIEWGGAQRWLIAERDDAAIDPARVRAAAAKAGGHATLFRNGDKGAGVFTALPPALMDIHRRLKQTFDLAGIFNRGRLYPEL
ncbi:MAG: glycolate oxidase subunit GlcE [Candidatus Protistobacter heckmanni]|nr:glycolate oxidase subunit GlcE [Candidatus Protistobacter heckmanni]